MKRPYFHKRMIALRERIEDISPDTLWIIQPENRRYLSGFKAGDPHLTESSGSLLINGDNAILVTDSRFTLEAQKEAQNSGILSIDHLYRGLYSLKLVPYFSLINSINLYMLESLILSSDGFHNILDILVFLRKDIQCKDSSGTLRARFRCKGV